MNTKSTTTDRRTQQSSSPKLRPSWLIWALFIIAMAGSFHEYVIQKEDGSYELREERKKKRDREIDGLREPATQYALIATEDGY